ncbi:MAG: phosphotransferase [Candidatus Fimadaptatus sp.]
MCEEILTGGRVTASVVRIGDTVHRSPCGNSGFVREVLSHLERRGADFAPRWLGVDEWCREVFSFMPGSVPDNIGEFTDAQCCAAARMIARMHALLCDMPACAPGQTVCHRDLSPCNFTFVQGMPVGMIDWDAAAVGDPRADLAYAMWMWLDIGNDEQDPAHVARRMRMMRDAYGRFSLEELYWVMLDEMARVGRGVFPTEEQTLATHRWTQACRDWCERRLAGELQ